MYEICIKVFRRDFPGDKRYEIETHYIYDSAFNYWNGRKTVDVETLWIRKFGK